MSHDWTPAELQAASSAMKASGHMSYEEFCAELDNVPMNLVRVTLADGDVITTRINGTDEEIRQHYCVGSALNMGATCDRLVEIVAVDISPLVENRP